MWPFKKKQIISKEPKAEESAQKYEPRKIFFYVEDDIFSRADKMFQLISCGLASEMAKGIAIYMELDRQAGFKEAKKLQRKHKSRIKKASIKK